MGRAAASSPPSRHDRRARLAWTPAAMTATPPTLDRLVRFLIAVGTQRLRLHRAHGRDVAHVAALHPDDLDEIRALGEEAYARNSRPFLEVLGLDLVGDETVPRNRVEVRQ